MKCSPLLKPNKITYMHQGNNSKPNLESKGKASSRNSLNMINQRSSMPELMEMVSSQSRKNVLSSHHNSNKQNQPKNRQLKDGKKDSLPKEISQKQPNPISKNMQNPHKGLQMYLSEKIPKPSKPNRNMSMHISRRDALQEIPIPNSRLNNSSITPSLLPINKKKRPSKPLVEHSSLLNINHHFIHNNNHSINTILNRSSLSDKSVLMKEKENGKRINQRNYDSSKSVQNSKISEQSKSLNLLVEKEKKTHTAQTINSNTINTINTNKSSIIKNSYTNPITTKPQSKPKSILVLKENKANQSSRKIKRNKLVWLFLLNLVFSETSKKRINHCSLYDIIQGLKLYEKKNHPIEEHLLKDQSQQDELITLTQLLLFVKLTLLNCPSIINSKIVFKQQSKQIDPQKSYLTFNQFGKIIFSQWSILKYIQTQQISSRNLQPTSSFPNQNNPQTQKQSPSQTKNSHNISTKQDQQIVQTARFQQNHHGYHHSRQSSDGMEKKPKKKSLIFTDPNHHNQIYSSQIDLISAKLQKSSHQNNRKPSTQQANYPSPVDKSFISRKSSSSTSNYPKSNGTTNKQISHCSIQDISQILQMNQNQKPLVTSFNKKFYPSIQNNSKNIFSDPFAEDSLMNYQEECKNSNGIQEICLSKGMESGRIQSCRIQALNMNSSLLFLESVILNNLYHTNFNVSFSDELIDNDESLMRSLKEMESIENFNKLQDVIQQVQNILKSMKNLFSLDCESTSQQYENRLFTRNLKQSIKIQDLTEMQEFLEQFIDYKIFRREKKSSNVSKSEYFNAVKLTQSNLTSLQTIKAAQKVIKSSLVAKYFLYMEGIRINNAPVLIQNIDRLLVGNNQKSILKIKILNLADNQLVSLEGVMSVVEKNIEWLEFLNLSGNRIESIEEFFTGENNKRQQSDKSYLELRELHLKNNRISIIKYRPSIKPSSSHFIFPSLELLDLRSNMVPTHQKSSIESIISQSPNLSIMSLKLNPIITEKTPQRTSLQKLLDKRSIYEYDSLQMMSAYIKYKDITFSDSGQNCCSLIQQEDRNEDKENHKAQKRNMKEKKNIERSSRIIPQPINKKKVRGIKNIQLEDGSC